MSLWREDQVALGDLFIGGDGRVWKAVGIARDPVVFLQAIDGSGDHRGEVIRSRLFGEFNKLVERGPDDDA